MSVPFPHRETDNDKFFQGCFTVVLVLFIVLVVIVLGAVVSAS